MPQEKQTNSKEIENPGEPIASIRIMADYAFCFFLVFACVLGGKSLTPLLIFGLIPIFWARRDIVLNTFSAVPFIVKFATVAYFLHGMVYLTIYPGIPRDLQPPPNPSWELYLVAILMLLIGFIRGADIDDLRIKLTTAIAPSLYISFIVLTIYAILDVTGDGRVQAAAAWPFIPALLFSMWAFIGLAGWAHLSASQRLLRLGLISLSIVVVHGYTGSRGVGLAHSVVLLLLFFMSIFAGEARRRLPNPTALGAAVVIGLILFTAHQGATSNGAILRLQHVSDFLTHYIQRVPASDGSTNEGAIPPSDSAATQSTQSEVSEPQAQRPATSDASTNIRIDMWIVSLREISTAPLFGHGALSMKTIIDEKFGLQHNHNQFLSWLLTGGLLLFILGTLFLLTPTLSTPLMAREDRFLIFVSTFVLWGAAMMFDSFLSLKFYLHYFCLLAGIIAAMAAREQTHKEKCPQTLARNEPAARNSQ